MRITADVTGTAIIQDGVSLASADPGGDIVITAGETVELSSSWYPIISGLSVQQCIVFVDSNGNSLIGGDLGELGNNTSTPINTLTTITDTFTAPAQVAAIGYVGAIITGLQGGQYIDNTLWSVVLPTVSSFAAATLVYSGAPANGNLIGSWAGASGTDQYGNTYPQGLSISTGVISGSLFEGLDFQIDVDGIRFYSGPPASGNLIGCWAIAPGTDFYGNVFKAGLTIGSSASTQVQIQSVSGAGTLGFLFNSASFTNALFRAASSSFAQIVLQGPATTTPGYEDTTVLEMNSANTGSGNANMSLIYNDTSGGANDYLVMDSNALHMTVNDIYGTTPLTGTGPSNPATTEGWHSLSLNSGFTGTGIRYKMIPIGGNGGTLWVEGAVSWSGTGNSIIATLPTGWIPPAIRNLPVGFNNPSSNASMSTPWIFYNTAGGIELAGYEVANIGVFWSHFIPFD
jgi:hypothetical protein